MNEKPATDMNLLLTYTQGKDKAGINVKDTGMRGRGLFAKKTFKEGDQIFTEKPIVASQFLWNALYKYVACEHCLKSMETAQEMAERLSGNRGLELPHPECCETLKTKDLISNCLACQVQL